MGFQLVHKGHIYSRPVISTGIKAQAFTDHNDWFGKFSCHEFFSFNKPENPVKVEKSYPLAKKTFSDSTSPGTV